MTNHSHALIVLGMHRSGTSAITGVLHMLGATVGSCLIPPKEGVNPKGYWEHANISAFHERLLNHLGSGWFDAGGLPGDWWQAPDVIPFRDELTELIKVDFSNETFWAVKDPRLCRLLPLWLQVLPQLDVSPSCLLMLRHPAEVAASLGKRDGIGLPHALLLWLRYVIESERNSRHLPRAVVVYEDLLADWQKTMNQVENKLGLGLQVDSESAATRVGEFLESKLRHHVILSQPNRDDALLGLAVEIYDTLRANDLSRLDGCASQLEKWVNISAPWLAETSQLMRQIGELQTHLSQTEGQIVAMEDHISRLEQEIHRVKTSLSWNVTKPLRAVQTLFNYFRGGG